MDYSSTRWPEYSSIHHYHHSAPHPHPHPNPNPNPNPNANPNPNVFIDADPYTAHGRFSFSHSQMVPTPSPYYGHGTGGGGPHGFSVKEAIRQYGTDPSSFVDQRAAGYADPSAAAVYAPSSYAGPWVAGYADPPPPPPPAGYAPVSYAGLPRPGYADPVMGYAPAPPRPSIGPGGAPPSRPPWCPQPYASRGVKKTAYCKVCKIDCTSQEALNSYKQGKKHKRSVQKLRESITRKKPQGAMGKGKAVAAGEEKKRKEAGPPATEEDLETKKRRILEGGAAPDGVRVCTICNVAVNSQKVYDLHVAGQRHLAMVMVKQKQEAAGAAS